MSGKRPEKRRDNKNRVLKEGETQRTDGRYMYRYFDSAGERQAIYSWRLVETDSYPIGKKKDLSLREKEALIQKDLMDGIITSGASMTLNDLFEKYMRTKRELSDNVRDTYIAFYKNHIKTNIGNRQIKTICKDDVLRVYEKMADDDLSNGTIHNVHNNVLFPTLQYAVDSEWLRKNPAKECLKGYSYDSMDKREALTIEEQEIFLEFMSNDKVYSKYLPIVLLVLETALRRGEVLGLTWKDVDFKNKLLNVNHQLHYYSVKGKCVFAIGKPKTKSGIRKIPLTQTALTLLQNIKQSEYFSNASLNIQIDGYKNFLFLNSRKNNVIIPRQFGDSLIAACKKYNKKEQMLAEKENREPKLLPMITPHILRHTACTRLSESGVDIKVLQKLLGHKKFTTTANIYDHADLHRMIADLEKVNVVDTAYLMG